jgi:tellurite resistance protein TehA-like permease
MAMIATNQPTQTASDLREAIRQFTPNWFTVTMGTGILALALNQAPSANPASLLVAEGLWLVDIGLYLLFAGLYVARWIMFPAEARPHLWSFGDVDVLQRNPDGSRHHH